MNQKSILVFNLTHTQQKIINALFILGHNKAYSEFTEIKERSEIKHDLVLRRNLSVLENIKIIDIKAHPFDKRKKLYGLSLDGLNLGNMINLLQRRYNERY